MDELKRIAFATPFRYEEAVRYTATLRNFGIYFSVLYVITIFSIKLVMARFKPFQVCHLIFYLKEKFSGHFQIWLLMF